MIADKKRRGLKQRLEALADDYSDLNTALENETDPIRKASYKRQLESVSLEMDEIEKALAHRHNPLESWLHEIDFKRLEQILRTILTTQPREACAALFLFQQSTRMGGDWCAVRIRKMLEPMTRAGQFRHVPVEFQPGGRADHRALLRRLGQDLGIDATGQDLPAFCQAVVQRLCQSLRNGSIYLIECRRCDYLKHDPGLFRWLLEDFWKRLLHGLATVAQDYDEIKVIMLLFVDGVLPPACLPAAYCCQQEPFQRDRLLEIPLEPWQQPDIREWIARYSGLALRHAELDLMAEHIYDSTQGEPTLVAHALLRECGLAMAG